MRWSFALQRSAAVLGLSLLCMVNGCGSTTPVPAETIPIGLSGSPVASGVIPSPAPEATLPRCAPPVERPLELPTPFAPNFPFPPGLIIYRSATLRNDPSHTHLQITAIAPLSLLKASEYLDNSLRKAGYKVVRADSEPGEVDGQFNGNGWVGSYRINALENCSEATTWTIRVLKL